MNWRFVYPNNIPDASQCLRQATNLALAKSAFHGPKARSCSTKDIVYREYVHQLLKAVETNMFTMQPSHFHGRFGHSWLPALFWYSPFTIMTCLDISFLLDLLPSWLKHFIAIPSHSDQSYASSTNTSLLEERSSSLASHKRPINPLTEYVPGITVLVRLPPIHLPHRN